MKAILSKQRNVRITGFTIVELLIVIVVIGILAAISIVAYSGVQQRAKVATVQSEISIMLKKAEISKILDPSGSYPNTSAGMKQLLVDSGVWATTRTDARTYALCASATNLTVISVHYASGFSGVMYYGATGKGQSTFVYDATVAGNNFGEKLCNQTVVAPSTYIEWAHNLI